MDSKSDIPAFRYSRRSVIRAGVGSILASAGLGGTADANALRIGAAAPAASLTTLDGKKVSTGDLLGSVVILTFWATWCTPCREELPLLSQYALDHAADGLRVLGFSLDMLEDLSAVKQVAGTLSFPVGLLAESSAPGYGRMWRLPVSFTIDRAGRLAVDGWKEKKTALTKERLEQVVTPLLMNTAN